ncbi:Lactation elevated protein 1 [Hordeum vulgare]|nr:Lactation elevated protein 1 [Hordeum vulgare]
MKASEPSPVIVKVIHVPTPPLDLVVDHVVPVVVQPFTTQPRKRQGNVIVQGGASATPTRKACTQSAPATNPGRTMPTQKCKVDKIAQERYKYMKTSCDRSFNLEHCWKLLQHSQKWELIDKESPPKRGSLTETDDDDGPRNKNKSDGNKKDKDKIKRELEASSLCDKINAMTQNELMVAKTLEARKELAEKKAQDKQEK